MTADSFLHALRRRQGEEMEIYTHADGGPSDEHGWWFGFTLDDQAHDGAGSGCRGDNEGVSIFNTTATVAAHFAAWVLQALVPPGGGADFNTRAAMEAGLPDEVLTHHAAAELETVFREHLADL
ncbi:hypothetical protein ABTZ03_31065 [Kitasatospora sp. NPDC096077]|uniref:hypothetical protein n=1 Tax=Kitasatospora sp. NPDC096077 TaxID=3155544 RepID=UPI00332432CA